MTRLSACLVVLVLYLWAMGGFGWVVSYELAEKRRMSPLGRFLCVVAWPVFSFFSLIGDLFQTGR